MPDHHLDHRFDTKVAKRFVHLAGGWWRGETWGTAARLSVGLSLLLLINVGINFLLNLWNRYFFDALIAHDKQRLVQSLLFVIALVAASAAIAVGIVRFRETLQVRWREWLIRSLVQRWLHSRLFYRMSMNAKTPSNPEYLIADDTRLATEPVVDFFIGIASAIISFFTFVGVLFIVGGAIQLPLFGTTISLPAYMVLAALVYGAIMVALTAMVGRSLPGHIARRNAAEAVLRSDLTRIRENAQPLAAMDGAKAETRHFNLVYSLVVTRWLSVVRTHGNLTWVTYTSAIVVPILPLLLAAPKFLSGEFTLGQVTQLAGAFIHVQTAMVWVVDNFRQLAQCYASVSRLDEFDHAMREAEQPKQATIRHRLSTNGALTLSGLTATKRNGDTLIADLDLTVGSGEKVLLSGAAGTGKSALIAAIIGLWPWGTGEIIGPDFGRIAVVTQKPYIASGLLKDALVYPLNSAEISDESCAVALETLGLSALVGSLHTRDDWGHILSNGERLALAVARLLILEPQLVIFDSAFTDSDDAELTRLLGIIDHSLPDMSRICITERPAAFALHSRWLRLVKTPDGATLEDFTIQKQHI